MSESPTPETNLVEYSVSDLSGALKRVVEDAFGHVRVRGEISGYRGPHSSGHAYFALKDDRSRIEAVIWRGTMSRLRFPPEEGMEVIATGRLTTYPGSSKYQIVIEQIEPAGAGALMVLLEERRKKLAAEGLFDAARKQLLPHMPRVIGVITSPTGAVIRDIIHRITDRFPLHVVVWPIRVQGETCGPEAAAAVRGFNALPEGGPVARPDVIIVARGGGSLEDLWGFNDEVLVRAVAQSDIPVISAVGHETDWTLIDYAADVRAPTPTGAAEMAVPVKAELEAAVASLGARVSGAISRLVDERRKGLRATARALPSLDQLLALPRRRFDEAAARLGRALITEAAKKRATFESCGRRIAPALLERRIERARDRLKVPSAALDRGMRRLLADRRAAATRYGDRLTVRPIEQRMAASSERATGSLRRLDGAIAISLERRRRRVSETERLLGTLSYRNVLRRGFAVVRDAHDTPMKRAADIKSGQALKIEFADGTVEAVASGRPQPPAKPKKATAAGGGPGGGQGQLL
jgi:exodeoxyribonuclease VII large subunit